MKTKRLMMGLVFVLSSSAMMSQNEEQKTSFGVLVGVNFQNLNGKDANGDKLENDLIVGYHAGVNIQLPIAPEFFFQPGLLISTKGTNSTITGFEGKYNLTYLELPINLLYKGLLGTGYIYLGFGPYISYAIGGKAPDTDIEFQNVVETGDPSDVIYFKALDAGGNIFAGYEFGNGLFGQLNTQFGMLKINPEDRRIADDKTAVRNTGFGISLGYRF